MAVLLEICAQSYVSAIVAQTGKADRIELCSAVELGGLTPSLSLIRAVQRDLTIPICVLVRPRGGDFVYTNEEFDIIKNDVIWCRDNGVDAVVVGCLDKNNELDESKMKELARLAYPLDIVCHRAFDRTPSPSLSLEKLINWGYTRVLTSGGAQNAVEGTPELARLVKQAEGRIEILACGTVRSENVVALVQKTGAQQVHSSANRFYAEKDCSESDVEEVKKIVQCLKFEENTPQYFK
jgi:copper homeostasis protein